MELPLEVPVMTLANATLFPQALLPLHIFEPRYRRMLRDVLDTHRMITVAMRRPDRARETPCSVAGLGLVRVSVRHSDGTSHLILQGLSRVELTGVVRSRPYRIHLIRPLPVPSAPGGGSEALVGEVIALVARCLEEGRILPPLPRTRPGPDHAKGLAKNLITLSASDVLRYLENLGNPELIADMVSGTLLRHPVERQTILETADVSKRLHKLISFLKGALDESQPGAGLA